MGNWHVYVDDRYQRIGMLLALTILLPNFLSEPAINMT